jgi:hypothetical protein
MAGLKIEARGELDLTEHMQAILRSTMWKGYRSAPRRGKGGGRQSRQGTWSGPENSTKTERWF